MVFIGTKKALLIIDVYFGLFAGIVTVYKDCLNGKLNVASIQKVISGYQYHHQLKCFILKVWMMALYIFVLFFFKSRIIFFFIVLVKELQEFFQTLYIYIYI